jgi:signal transduction histidine kinase
MMTHGLSQCFSAVCEPTPLPTDIPALRIDVRARAIAAINPALADLLGCATDAIVGRPPGVLWPSAERAAIERRLYDTVLVGRDAFGCLALVVSPGRSVFVDVEAHYAWHEGQHVDVTLCPCPVPWMVGPRAAGTPVGEASAGETGRDSGALDAACTSPGAPMAGPAGAVAPANGMRAGDGFYLVMTALSAAGAAALAVDGVGLVVSATPEAETLLSRPIARLRGTHLDTLLTLPDVAQQALAVARRSQERQSVAAALAADGRQVAMEWLPGNEPGAGFAVLVADRPESVDAERLRIQSRLVSFVSHDVRDSLAAAFCSLRNLADASLDQSPERGFVDKALGEIQRASRIVDDVLAVSRPGSLVVAPLHLSTVLRDTVDRFRSRAASGGVEVIERLGADVRVAADLGQLERAFANLVENALQATPHYGTLTVTTQIEDRGQPGVRMDFADTGMGIKAALRPNVFEPFVTDKPGGTGLGLAITWRVVVNHGGQISFVSEEGRGTTFTIWLPRLEVPPVGADPAQSVRGD